MIDHDARETAGNSTIRAEVIDRENAWPRGEGCDCDGILAGDRRAIARCFAEAGCRVVVNYRRSLEAA
jgi:hypothetical protein